MPPSDSEEPFAEELPLGPLPSGRHRFTADQVAHHQRERLIASIAAAVAEHGYTSVTVGEVAAGAHVSRRVFYEHFDSKEECFLAAFDTVAAHLGTLAAKAVAAHEGEWSQQVIAALHSVLDFFSSQPNLAHLVLVDALDAGPLLQRRFGEVAGEGSPLLRVGREERENGHPLPESTEVSLIGAAAAKLRAQLTAGGAASLPGLLPDLTEFFLAPYLGSDRANRIAAGIGGERKASNVPADDAGGQA